MTPKNEAEIKKYTQRIPADIHAAAKKRARERGQSLNDYVLSLIEYDLMEKVEEEGFKFLTVLAEIVSKQINNSEMSGREYLNQMINENRTKFMNFLLSLELDDEGKEQ